MTVTAIAAPGKRSSRVQVERDHRHELIAVDECAVLVDGEHTITVAVDREAQRGTVAAHGRLQATPDAWSHTPR